LINTAHSMLHLSLDLHRAAARYMRILFVWPRRVVIPRVVLTAGTMQGVQEGGLRLWESAQAMNSRLSPQHLHKTK
jgi:hypothetical protein